jgi:hypothetical protein
MTEKPHSLDEAFLFSITAVTLWHNLKRMDSSPTGEPPQQYPPGITPASFHHNIRIW